MSIDFVGEMLANWEREPHLPSCAICRTVGHAMVIVNWVAYCGQYYAERAAPSAGENTPPLGGCVSRHETEAGNAEPSRTE